MLIVEVGHDVYQLMRLDEADAMRPIPCVLSISSQSKVIGKKPFVASADLN